MKKTVFILAAILFLFGSPAMADKLQADMKATDWSFKDADDKVFTMGTWAGKVMMINYVDPDESDLNEHFTDAMKKAKDDGRLRDETYKGIGIADCAATWKPNFAIRAIAAKKAKKYKSTILFDYKASLRDSWGLAKDTANAVILDKNRTCRAVIRGRVPDDQVETLVNLAIGLQKE